MGKTKAGSQNSSALRLGGPSSKLAPTGRAGVEEGARSGWAGTKYRIPWFPGQGGFTATILLWETMGGMVVVLQCVA